MENQEQNSVLANIKINNFIVEPLSQPHRVVIEITNDNITRLFDEFWEKNGENILHKFKVKSRSDKLSRSMAEKNIGIINLYGHLLASIVSKTVGKDLFFINSVELDDYNTEDNAKIIAIVYLMPELKMNDGFEFDWKLINPIRNTVDEELDIVFKDIQYKNRKFGPCNDGDMITKNHRVTLDVMAVCEDKPYDRGTVRNKVIDVEILQKEIRDEIINHKKGDYFEVNFVMDGRDEEFVGKNITSKIRVSDVLNIISPEIDDELIKSEGFESVDAFKDKFRDDFSKYTKSAMLGCAMDHVLNQIIQNCVIPPIPHTWIENNVNSFINEHMKRFNSRKEAMMALNVRKEDDLRDLFKHRVIQSLVQDLSLRQYADMNGLDFEDVDAVSKHILERIEWVKP